eukprot:m.857222 g.857222  ORF g.857222 m.857222 type:complete len:50 (-) comp59644_c0_seq3:800-949(-)
MLASSIFFFSATSADASHIKTRGDLVVVRIHHRRFDVVRADPALRAALQ